jgi:hypothetical protein
VAGDSRLGALWGAGGDVFQGAKGFVDGVGVGEGVEQVGGDQDDVGSLLHAGVVLAAHAFAEVERGALGEGVEFRRLLHVLIIAPSDCAARRERQIWSFRLRLHSGLRQRGGGFGWLGS